MSYQIEYTDAAIEHLKILTTRQQRTVLDTVDEQLKYEPLVETRNRKSMEPNSLATWELRIGNLRVYYDVEENLESRTATEFGSVRRKLNYEISRTCTSN